MSGHRGQRVGPHARRQRGDDPVVGRLRDHDRRRPGGGRPRRQGGRRRARPDQREGPPPGLLPQTTTRSVGCSTATPPTPRCSPWCASPSRRSSRSSWSTSAATCPSPTTSRPAATSWPTRSPPTCSDRSVALMANHGMLAIGRDADDALHTALCVEHNARIIWGARALGRARADPRQEHRGLHRRLPVRPRQHLEHLEGLIGRLAGQREGRARVSRKSPAGSVQLASTAKPASGARRRGPLG